MTRQNSFWQMGCDDAKAGKPVDRRYRYDNGYLNGHYYGQHGKGHPDPAISHLYTRWDEDGQILFQPDPPLKNPYMEAIENIEGIIQRLQTFANEFPASLDSWAKDDYTSNLLKIRDDLHALQQGK